jgi:hypothetical protein
MARVHPALPSHSVVVPAPELLSINVAVAAKIGSIETFRKGDVWYPLHRTLQCNESSCQRTSAASGTSRNRGFSANYGRVSSLVHIAERRRTNKMSNPTEQKPKRNAGQRSQKSTQKPDGNERMGPAMAGADTVATSAHADLAPANTVAAPAKTISAPANAISRPVNAVPAPAKAILAAPAHAFSAPAKINLVSVNTFSSIAAAYSDYSKKSFEDTKCFVEKLAGVRSFDKAVEVQMEYAKAAYATFAAESLKIRQLYGDLAKQTFKPFEASIAKTTRAAP